MAAYIANHFNKDLVILRKKKRDFFKEVISAESSTFTTHGSSTLYLDVTNNKKYLENKKVLIFDDVISTWSSLKAINEILEKVNANVVGKAFIFNEGDAVREENVYYVSWFTNNWSRLIIIQFKYQHYYLIIVGMFL